MACRLGNHRAQASSVGHREKEHMSGRGPTMTRWHHIQEQEAAVEMWASHCRVSADEAGGGTGRPVMRIVPCEHTVPALLGTRPDTSLSQSWDALRGRPARATEQRREGVRLVGRKTGCSGHQGGKVGARSLEQPFSTPCAHHTDLGGFKKY